MNPESDLKELVVNLKKTLEANLDTGIEFPPAVIPEAEPSIDMTPEPADTLESLKEHIEKGFKKMADQLFETKKKELVDELNKRKDEYVAGVSLHLMRTISCHYVGPELHVVVKSIDNESQGGGDE